MLGRTWQGMTDQRARPALLWRLLLAVGAFPTLVAAGTAGYMVIEGWSLSDALFMAATTITTVGFGEVHPLSGRGRLFTIILLLIGLAAVWYALSVLVSVVVNGELAHHWEERRMEHQVHHLRDHHIVAGFGRVGRQTAQALRRLGHQVVVVDESPDAVRDAITADFLVVVGNATDDETLLSAGVERAAGLITALGSDADNVYVTLSSRALNPVLPIVARANSEGVLSKLTRAGATQVVSPYATTGRQLAQSVVRTRTTGEIVGSGSETSATLIVEALPLAPTSPLVGMTMQMLHERLPQPILLAVLRDGQTLAPPPPDLTLASGDELVAVGTESNLRLLTECDGLTR